MSTWKSIALAAAALTGVACSPKYGQRVPDELVTRLPFETRIELLEAENDLAVAIDKRDEAENEIMRARDGLRRAKSRLSAAEDEVGRADDPKSKEIAELAVDEANARVEFLRAQQEENVARLNLEQLQLQCAMARFEYARFTAAQKAKVEGIEKLQEATFKDQVAACDDDVKAKRAELKANQQTLAADAKAAWESKKTALAKKTFDARASPYVE